MPKAPADYQMRYPIDFAEIGPHVHKVVQLYAQDLGKSRGILWMPPKGKPKTCVIMAHPRGEFGHHYSVPFWVAAGYAAFAHNTRYLNNDSTMIHESILLDLAAAMKYLREEEGFEHIVMLGNSGGGSLFSYYDAQARAPKGSRVASPPGGGPPDLNKYDFPTGNGFIVLAAHPGQGMVLMNCLDAAVVDEKDPLASDPDLDMYDERNGFKAMPSESRYSPEFLAKYRAAQRSRCARIDAIARHHIAEAKFTAFALRCARRVSQNEQLATRYLVERRAMAPHIMLIYRTLANPNYLDLSLEPSERVVGSIFAPRPDIANYAVFGLGRIVTPDAWLSTWYGLVVLAGAQVGGEFAESDGTHAGGGRERRSGHLHFGCEGGVRGRGRERQAAGVHRGRRSLHASGRDQDEPWGSAASVDEGVGRMDPRAFRGVISFTIVEG